MSCALSSSPGLSIGSTPQTDSVPAIQVILSLLYQGFICSGSGGDAGAIGGFLGAHRSFTVPSLDDYVAFAEAARVFFPQLNAIPFRNPVTALGHFGGIIVTASGNVSSRIVPTPARLSRSPRDHTTTVADADDDQVVTSEGLSYVVHPAVLAMWRQLDATHAVWEGLTDADGWWWEAGLRLGKPNVSGLPHGIPGAPRALFFPRSEDAYEYAMVRGEDRVFAMVHFTELAIPRITLTSRRSESHSAAASAHTAQQRVRTVQQSQQASNQSAHGTTRHGGAALALADALHDDDSTPSPDAHGVTTLPRLRYVLRFNRTSLPLTSMVYLNVPNAWCQYPSSGFVSLQMAIDRAFAAVVKRVGHSTDYHHHHGGDVAAVHLQEGASRGDVNHSQWAHSDDDGAVAGALGTANSNALSRAADDVRSVAGDVISGGFGGSDRSVVRSAGAAADHNVRGGSALQAPVPTPAAPVNTTRHYELMLSPMPLAPRFVASFLLQAGTLLPILVSFTFLYTVSQGLSTIVAEKELGIRETALTMGFTLGAHHVSFYIVELTFISISCAPAVAVVAFVFSNCSVALLYVTFWLYAAATIALTALISVFFERARTAALVGPLVVFITNMVYFGTMSVSGLYVDIFKNIFPSSSFARLITFYAERSSINYVTTFYDVFADEEVRYTLPILAAIVIAYATAAFYIDVVVSDSSHDIFFFLRASYHCPSSVASPEPTPSQHSSLSRVPHSFPPSPTGPTPSGPSNVSHVPRGRLPAPVNAPIGVSYDADMTVTSEDALRAQAAQQHGGGPPVGRLFEPLTALQAARVRVSLRNLTKTFSVDGATVRAVRDVSLDLCEGDITILLGHNGAGKTTTVSMLTGALPVTSGDASVYGASVRREMHVARRSIGLCPQRNVLWPRLSAYEHLRFYATIKGVPSREMAAEIDAALREVRLLNRAHVPAQFLSGGQKRKLSVAMALIGGSRLVFLDEPTAGMDVQARAAMWSILRRIKDGRVVVMSTHYMDEAELLGDRVAIMQKGVLFCSGSPLFLKSRLGVGYCIALSYVDPMHAAGWRREARPAAVELGETLVESTASGTVAAAATGGAGGDEPADAPAHGAGDGASDDADGAAAVRTPSPSPSRKRPIVPLSPPVPPRVAPAADPPADAAAAAAAGGQTDGAADAAGAAPVDVAEAPVPRSQYEPATPAPPLPAPIEVSDAAAPPSLAPTAEGLVPRPPIPSSPSRKLPIVPIVAPPSPYTAVPAAPSPVGPPPTSPFSPNVRAARAALIAHKASTVALMAELLLAAAAANSGSSSNGGTSARGALSSSGSFPVPHADAGSAPTATPQRGGGAEALNTPSGIGTLGGGAAAALRGAIGSPQTAAEVGAASGIVEVLSDAGCEMIVRVPMSATESLGALCDTLDARADALGLRTYAVSPTTMEEVFLSIANDHADEDNDATGAAAPPSLSTIGHTHSLSHGPPQSPQRAGRTTSTVTSPKAAAGAPSSPMGSPKASPPPLLQPLARAAAPVGFLTHFPALVAKRIHCTKRDKRSLFCMGVLPVAFIGLSLLLFVMVDPIALDPFTFTPAPSGETVVCEGTNSAMADAAYSFADPTIGANVVRVAAANSSVCTQWLLANFNEHKGKERRIAIVSGDVVDMNITVVDPKRPWNIPPIYTQPPRAEQLNRGLASAPRRRSSLASRGVGGGGVDGPADGASAHGVVVGVSGADAPVVVSSQSLGSTAGRNAMRDAAAGDGASLARLLGSLSADTSAVADDDTPDASGTALAAVAVALGAVANGLLLPQVASAAAAAASTISAAAAAARRRAAMVTAAPAVRPPTTPSSTMYGVKFITQRATVDASAFFNFSNPNAIPLAVSAVSNAAVNVSVGGALPDGYVAVETVSHPFPMSDYQQALVDTTKVVITALFILIPFTFIPANFAVFVVRERETKATHLQYVSGVSPLTYWLSSYVVDMSTYLVTVLLSLGMFKFFSYLGISFASAYVETWDDTLATFTLFMSYGFSVAPFVYCISFAFEKHNVAQNAMVILGIALGFVMVIGSTLLVSVPSTHEVGLVLARIFRFFPHFCLGEGLVNLAARVLVRTALSIEISPWDMAQGIGRNLVYMYSTMGIAWVAVGALEGGYVACILRIPWYNMATAPFRFVASTCCVQAAVGLFKSCCTSAPPPEADGDDDDEEGGGSRARRAAAARAALAVEDDDDVIAERASVMKGREGDCLVVKDLRMVFPSSRTGVPPKVAVAGVTFGVPSGEVFAFLGTNGAGKTTTLSILSGEFEPTSGTAAIEGNDVVLQRDESRRNLGYCPQFDAVLDLMTVDEHLDFYGKLRGLTARQIATDADALCGTLGLNPHRRKPAGTLSGGNKRKLSIALALIGGPAVIFLDEPSAGLDPVARRALWGALSTLTRGCSVVLTTHHLEEVEALAQRVGIMVDGRLACIGSLSHLKRKFGVGYEVQLRCESEDDVIACVDAVVQTFPGSEVVSANGLRRTIQVPAKELALGAVFRSISNLRSMYRITDYTVGQTSLEQVFLRASASADVGEGPGA